MKSKSITTLTAAGLLAAIGTMAFAADNMQSKDELRTSKIVGSKVYNDANESIGSVEDIVIKPDGSMDEVVLSVGGFLGIGTKYVAVPFNDLKISRDGNSLKVAATGTKESLKALPNYEFYNANSGTAATQTTHNQLSQGAQQFLKTAIQGDLAEVQMGKLAQENGQSQEAKQFGQTLEHDHTQNLQKAQQLAQQNNIQTTDQPTAEQQQEYQRLSDLSGQNFDQQFAEAMIQDHKKTISEFQKQANGQDVIAQFAQQSLPTLQKHLEAAQSLASQGAATGAGNQ